MTIEAVEICGGGFNPKHNASLWDEYDNAADWCAARRIEGNDGDALPPLLDAQVAALIADDPSAFRRRVCDCAYARAMSRRAHPDTLDAL